MIESYEKRIERMRRTSARIFFEPNDLFSDRETAAAHFFWPSDSCPAALGLCLLPSKQIVARRRSVLGRRFRGRMRFEPFARFGAKFHQFRHRSVLLRVGRL